MQRGFVLDQTKCIGCHACTVACKQENDVPIGGFRTWVKYVETGNFPDVKRHFAVMRCNQCTRAPCVAICPTKALHKRPDGIVDLDRDLCIGCKACMEACPYEAIHLDPEKKVASKCHFCAHRVEKGMAPACAAVCPTQAIQLVDLHNERDPNTIRVRSGETTVRRPEKLTGPNVHYIGASPLALRPEAAHRPSAWLWSQRAPGREEGIGVGPADVKVVMEPVHVVPWGWHVTTFLLLKGTEAGFAFFAPFFSGLPNFLAPLIATLGTCIVAALMVADLGQPKRFYLLLTHGNPRSWLVRGAWLLTAYGMIQGIALIDAIVGSGQIAEVLGWIGALLSPLVAGYSGMLFAQCEGRDLWRSSLVIPRMLIQSIAAGAALGVAFGLSGLLAVAMVGFIAYALLALYFRSADTQAAHFLRSARPWKLNPLPVLLVGILFLSLSMFFPPIAVLAIATLFVEDSAWIRAGQLPPNA